MEATVEIACKKVNLNLMEVALKSVMALTLARKG